MEAGTHHAGVARARRLGGLWLGSHRAERHGGRHVRRNTTDPAFNKPTGQAAPTARHVLWTHMLTGIRVALGRWELGGSCEPASVRERPVATLCKVAECGRLRHALPATAPSGRTFAAHGPVTCGAAPAPHG